MWVMRGRLGNAAPVKSYQFDNLDNDTALIDPGILSSVEVIAINILLYSSGFSAIGHLRANSTRQLPLGSSPAPAQVKLSKLIIMPPALNCGEESSNTPLIETFIFTTT